MKVPSHAIPFDVVLVAQVVDMVQEDRKFRFQDGGVRRGIINVGVSEAQWG